MGDQKQEQLQYSATGQEGEFEDKHRLDYAVKGRPAFAFVDIMLRPNQKCFADTGTMIWMDGDIPMTTGCLHGGCVNAWMRTCAGESCCQNEFKGPPNGGKVSFGLDLPGDLLPFAVTPDHGWIISRKSFLCGSDNIKVSARFAGCLACCCSGEGTFLTRITVEKGRGMFFAGNYGSLERHEIPAGKTFFVDTGLFFAAHEKTQIHIGKAGTVKAFCCGGEGLVMKFKGPCVLFTKSRDPNVFNRWSAGGTNSDAAAVGAASGAATAAAVSK